MEITLVRYNRANSSSCNNLLQQLFFAKKRLQYDGAIYESGIVGRQVPKPILLTQGFRSFVGG